MRALTQWKVGISPCFIVSQIPPPASSMFVLLDQLQRYPPFFESPKAPASTRPPSRLHSSIESQRQRPQKGQQGLHLNVYPRLAAIFAIRPPISRFSRTGKALEANMSSALRFNSFEGGVYHVESIMARNGCSPIKPCESPRALWLQ